MKRIKKLQNSPSVISTVLYIVFGLLTIIIGYVTIARTSFDLRSKAKYEQVLLKQYTFNVSKEGWKAKNFGSSTWAGGQYFLEIDSRTHVSKEDACYEDDLSEQEECSGDFEMIPLKPRIRHEEVDTLVMFPSALVTLRLSVTLPSSTQSGQLGNPWNFMNGSNSATFFLQKQSKRFPIKLSYRFHDAADFEPLVSAWGRMDGRMQEVTFALPRSVALRSIDELSISFEEIQNVANAVIEIDDIRIVGLKEIAQVPTPTPTSISDACAPNGSVCVMGGVCPSGAVCKRATGICINNHCVMGDQPPLEECGVIDGRRCVIQQCVGYSCPPGDICPDQPKNCVTKLGVCRNRVCVSAAPKPVQTIMPLESGCREVCANDLCRTFCSR